MPLLFAAGQRVSCAKVGGDAPRAEAGASLSARLQKECGHQGGVGACPWNRLQTVPHDGGQAVELGTGPLCRAGEANAGYDANYKEVRNLRKVQKILPVIVAGILLLALTVATGAQPAVTDEELIINPVPLGPVGSEAVFVITQHISMEVLDQTGLFAGQDPDDLVSHLDWAVRARVEVLPSDPGTGEARVLVQAQPIDYGTREPISDRLWEGVYRLGPLFAELEAGDEVPETYAQLVVPSWLVDWLTTPVSDLPSPVLRPGDTWESVAPMEELQELGIAVDALPVQGSFVGWLSIPELGTQAAHIVEVTDTMVSFTQPVDDDQYLEMEYYLEGISQVWLVPDDFIWASELSLDALLHMSTQPDAPEWLGGSMAMFMNVERIVEREPGGSLLEWAGSPWPVIAVGETVQGWLGEGSLLLFGDGSWSDVYTLYGTAGDELVIEMRSQDFDTYLALNDDTSGQLAWDDDGAGGTDSRIAIRLPYTGAYHILANAYFPETGGDYTLSVRRALPGELAEPEPEFGMPPLDDAALPFIAVGQTAQGWLGAGDPDFFGDGTWSHVYRLEGTAGTEVVIELRSLDFDAFLAVWSEDGAELDWDDSSGGGDDALIRMELPYTGVYYIVANAFFPGTGGSYTLSVQRAAVEAAPESGAGTVSIESLEVLSGSAGAGGQGGASSAGAGDTIAWAMQLLPGLAHPESLSDAALFDLEGVLLELIDTVWKEMDRRGLQ